MVRPLDLQVHSASRATTILHSQSRPPLVPFLNPFLHHLPPPRVVSQHLGSSTVRSQDANAAGAHNVCVVCANNVAYRCLAYQSLAAVYGPMVLTSSPPGSEENWPYPPRLITSLLSMPTILPLSKQSPQTTLSLLSLTNNSIVLRQST